MPRGDKSKYTDKQKRQAEHIEEGYEKRGTPKKEAERRAWATVNKESGGGNKSGSGRGKKDTHESSRKGGRKGGKASSKEILIVGSKMKDVVKAAGCMSSGDLIEALSAGLVPPPSVREAMATRTVTAMLQP